MIIKDKIFIEPFNLNRTLHIYIPDDIKKNEKLPVIYMYDGHNLFLDKDATYGKSWGLKKYLDDTNQRVIIVGLECNHKGNRRLCEFSPYSFYDERFGTIDGIGKKTVQWICEVLKPYIDKKYPTLSQREYTGIGGSSMGGLMSVYALATRSDIFSFGVCVSPFYEHIFEELVCEIENIDINPNTKAYISWGNFEFDSRENLAIGTEENLKIARIFSEKGIKVFPHLMIYGAHNEESWEKETDIWFRELGLYKK